MKIVITDGKDERFTMLCSKLDEYLNDIVGEEKQRSQYIQYNLTNDIHDVVLILEDNKCVACGSFKKQVDKTAEIKRVFVSEEYRRKHYGRTIMKELERIAKSKGYNRLILETGKPLIQAMNMYRSIGYKIIPNYGQYVDKKDSVCMEKIL